MRCEDCHEQSELGTCKEVVVACVKMSSRYVEKLRKTTKYIIRLLEIAEIRMIVWLHYQYTPAFLVRQVGLHGQETSHENASAPLHVYHVCIYSINRKS
jgi:hypothetical protein